MNYFKLTLKTIVIGALIDILLYIPVFFIEPSPTNKVIHNWLLMLFPPILIFLSLRKYTFEKLSILKRLILAWSLVVVIFLVQICKINLNLANLQLNPIDDPNYMRDLTISYAIILIVFTTPVAIFTKQKKLKG
jgi:hypothetical protein